MIGVIVLVAFQTIRYTPPNVFAMPFRNVPAARDNPAPANLCNHDGSISKSAEALLPETTHFQQPLTALVRVTIGANGDLLNAKIAQSTGNDAVDTSAHDAAKHSTYTPKFVSCKAVAASYIYKIVFKPH